jgi:Type I phosphodiesterase / nucleotide pyrophosphatase
MRRPTLPIALLFSFVAALWPLFSVEPSAQTAQTPQTPKLAVILVVDQLRTDYLEISRAIWRGGFRRLLVEGAFFEHGEYPYMNTVTCAGHATIGTGAFPHSHGMTLNAWYDRTSRRSINCNDDPDSPIVSYTDPAKPAQPAPPQAPKTAEPEERLGTSAKNLLMPTFGDELRSQKGSARVVTLSLKARSAIGLAGHGGTAVTWIDDGAASFVTSKAFAASRVPAVADFLKRDPIEADGTKSWTLRDAESTYRFADSTLGGRPQTGRTGLFPHRVGTPKGPDQPFFSLWQASPYSDAYLGRMAAALVDAFSLGQGDSTDFLGVSFSALDLVGHAYGPESREVEDMLRRLDDTIGALMTHLDAKVGRGKWVLGFSSDHGVAQVGVTSGGGRVVTEDIRDRIDETLRRRWGARPDGSSYVASVTFNYVYFATGVFARVVEEPAAFTELEKALVGIPGMVRLLRSDRLSATSKDGDVRSAALSYVPGRSGDIVLVSKPNWTFGPRGDASGTTHGTSHPYDRQVPVMLLGAGIKAGRYPQVASPADIAPTLAHLVGVKMPKAEGRVLKEALR